ncbi:alpha-ketoacid dehydrogenase subunit beta [Desulfatirhabdium butyrativorans]|uniref:alpha-ketoacid dehydrogenase subunit beta n=1 Tax=Desulfatirhabdium butyrativorans TaxID=340467 RepID=UPI000416E424|nr:alpha-ketoacid dehydrogenase subunit beta [Desulfatirhabdium butyrativorans]
MKEIRYIGGIKEAIREEMERDSRVVLIGEDVGKPGGSFGASRGLIEQFGPDRVIDTPISEAGFMGMAAGAAACGMRPVVEIMFMDFMTVCMDGVVNQIAKMRYMFGSRFSMPIVIRTPCGGGLNAGPQHSQCLEAWFAHVPGLKVVMPSTPYDVKGIMKSAIRDDNPVIVVENKALHALKGSIPEEEYVIPLGRADIKRTGSDVTVVATSRMVHESLKAAEILSAENIQVEIIDPVTISPWDKDRVFQSIAKTHRLVVAHEAVKQCGIGAEISAVVAEELMDELDAPIVRVGAPFVPVPFSLEQAYLPNAKDVVAGVRKVLEKTF